VVKEAVDVTMLELQQQESKNNVLPHKVPLSIPVSMLRSPAERFMARKLDETWVKELATPANGATLTNRIYSAVVFQEDLPEELLQQINTELNSVNFNLEECKANIEGSIKAFRAQLQGENAIFQVYAGNHGSHAVKNLSARYPRNPLFHQLQCTLMILTKTEENYDLLFSLGTFDNAAQMNARKTPFTEAAQRLRTQWKAIETHVAELPLDQQAKQLRTRSGLLLKNAAAAMMIQKGEIGLIMAVAKVSDAVWVPLLKILNGATALGDAGVPKSSAAFTKMAKIPDEKLVEWLNAVVAGTIKMKEFKSKCATWKNARKLWDEVLEICKDEIIAPEGTEDEKAWRSGLSPEAARVLLKEQFPTLVDVISDRAYQFRNSSVKELCAGSFMAQCMSIVQSEKAAKLASPSSQVCSLISI
jgi:hypothetical protein